MSIRYVLDTNAVAAVMKNDARVIDRMRAVAPDQLGVPQPVFAEIEYGIERLPRSKRRTQLAAQLARVRAVIPRIAWTDDVSARFGEIKAHLERAGRRIEDFDAAIAAHAVSLGAILVTTDVGHMTRVPRLQIEDWTA